MTGPAYPRPNPPGSNAVGSTFAIGISPIGTIPPFDVWTTVISQYANSPIIDALIVDMGAWLDQTANMDNFFDNIWNIATAVGNGLDVWGRILDVERVLQLSTGTFFGYLGQGGLSSGDPFNVSPFFSGGTLTQNFALTDPAFLTLLYAKALANICDGSIPAINQILLRLFPNRGNCFVTDGLDMTMTYTFLFRLSDVEFATLSQSGVLPTPAGVSSTIVQPP